MHLNREQRFEAQAGGLFFVEKAFAVGNDEPDRIGCTDDQDGG